MKKVYIGSRFYIRNPISRKLQSTTVVNLYGQHTDSFHAFLSNGDRFSGSDIPKKYLNPNDELDEEYERQIKREEIKEIIMDIKHYVNNERHFIIKSNNLDDVIDSLLDIKQNISKELVWK